MRLIVYFVLLYVFVASIHACNENDRQDRERDNFAEWIDHHKLPYEHFFVFELTGCNYCANQIIRLIQLGYLAHPDATPIVLVIRERSQLFPIKAQLDNDKLLIYNILTQQEPIAKNLPRMYFKQDDTFAYHDYTMPELEEWLDKANMLLNNRDFWHGSVKFSISGIAIPGNENFIILSPDGNSHQDIMLFDVDSIQKD